MLLQHFTGPSQRLLKFRKRSASMTLKQKVTTKPTKIPAAAPMKSCLYLRAARPTMNQSCPCNTLSEWR